MNKEQKQFNLLIVGTGGQGLITLLQIVSRAALIEGYDIRTSELHGLSQRGGSVEVHIRFGNKIYSPLVAQAKADLILALEEQEALRGIHFANQKTNFVINQNIIPIPSEKNLTEQEVKNILEKVSKNVIFVPAREICQQKLGKDVFACVYLLSWAVFKKLIPLEPDSVLKAIKKEVPEKHLEMNLRTFNLAKDTQIFSM